MNEEGDQNKVDLRVLLTTAEDEDATSSANCQTKQTPFSDLRDYGKVQTVEPPINLGVVSVVETEGESHLTCGAPFMRDFQPLVLLVSMRVVTEVVDVV